MEGFAVELAALLPDVAAELDGGAHLQHVGAVRVYSPHPWLLIAQHGEAAVLVVPAAVLEFAPELCTPFQERLGEGSMLIVIAGTLRSSDLRTALRRGVLSYLPMHPSAGEVSLAITRGLELIESQGHAESRGRSVARYQTEMGELVDIARAMTTERNVDKLLDLILQKSRLVTKADAGSIYVVENDESGTPRLRFKLTQNDSVHFDSSEFTMPISMRSIAGAAAMKKAPINLDDVYALPADSPFGFDQSFDKRVGYQTKSMLTMPLISQRDEVIGVIQLINHKTDIAIRITNREDVDAFVAPFDPRSEELLRTVAAQAGISLENALLYEEIRLLFEGFVRASVEAIEARDPTTSGHSRRVSLLTLGLARVVHDEATGPYRDAQFSTDELRELEYASLLHDFGKIGVRERVLVKAKKLYEERLELLRARFDYAEQSLEVQTLRRRIAAMERGASAADLCAFDHQAKVQQASFATRFATIVQANEPTVLAAGDFARIEEIAHETFMDAGGKARPLLDPEDVIALSVMRGSLTPNEYEEITSHVSMTFKFLQRIPWGKQLQRVPLIAGAHHERLNGTGYPNRLNAEAIPLQSKLMSIADIFDALTASDRPYKRAVPIDRALDILGHSVKDGHLDGELVRIFREARIWEGIST